MIRNCPWTNEYLSFFFFGSVELVRVSIGAPINGGKWCLIGRY